jgi:gas vesicle protein
MRVRSLLAMTTGAALGAGAMYLLDPETGETRRRDARRNALREVGRQGAGLASRGVQRAGTVVEAAVYGYNAERRTPSAHLADGSTR